MTGEDVDPDIYNAAGQFVVAETRRILLRQRHVVRDGTRRRIDTVILGAYEVDQTGSVANWSTADAKRGGIGGAMDLLSAKVI